MAHVIVLDSVNEDIFVCGLCKSVFNSLELFLNHKRSKCVHHNLGCTHTIENVFPETSSVINPADNAITSELQVESTEKPRETVLDDLIYSETPLVCNPGGNAQTCELQVESAEISREAAIDVLLYSETPLVYNSGDNALTNMLRPECTETPGETAVKELVFPEISSVCNPGDNALTSEPLAKSAETLCNAAIDELICTVCKKKFKMKKGLLAHTKSHFVKPYQCLVCGRCFFQNSHLKRHILSHKVWPEGLSKTTPKCPEVDLLSYSCPYCIMVFSDYNQFRSHLKNHQSFKKFKCIQGDCQDFYDTLDLLLHHVASFHITQLYVCHICKEPFNSLESIASHNDCGKISIQTKNYKCSQCEAVFTKPEKLYLHMLTENHHKVCIHCKKTFASDKRLRLHLQIHRDLKPFQCNMCHSSFHMKKYLNSHMLKHGTKEFVCPICKYKFNRSDLLQRHMRSHSPSKMFQCPYKDTLDCKREFSRKDKLKLHLKTHLGKLVEEKLQQKTTGENFATDSSNHQVDLSSNTE